MNESLASVSSLQAIARRMREREEQIQHEKQMTLEKMSGMIALASEQGRDCVLVKSKLPKYMRWGDWLHNHVPNLEEADAAKYERINSEQISNVRQAIFAFLPPAESQAMESRIAPNIWESAWGFITKLKKITTRNQLSQWPAHQIELTRKELEPVARLLWPDKF